MCPHVSTYVRTSQTFESKGSIKNVNTTVVIVLFFVSSVSVCLVDWVFLCNFVILCLFCVCVFG